MTEVEIAVTEACLVESCGEVGEAECEGYFLFCGIGVFGVEALW